MSDRPFRILQVLRAPVGGLFRHVADLTRGLVARGHAVGLVMDAADAGPRWERVIDELAAIAPLGVTRVAMARRIDLSDVSATRHMMQRIRAEAIDVVHGHGAKGGAYARIAGTLARRGGAPSRFYTPHGGSLHFAPSSLEGRLYHTLERMLARTSEAIFFESDFAKAGFADMLGLSSPEWPVVANGLLASEFEPIAVDPVAADVLFVGEMRTLKGVDVLIEALARLPAVRALLVGAGPDRAAFEESVARRGLAGRVRFADPMPARDAFARGRIVVMPSRAESLPYLALEAAAAGRPLIATDVGGIPEIFGAERSRLIPPADAEALAGAVRAALDDPSRAVAEAERLRAHVRTVFDVERMVEAIVATYRTKTSR